MSKSGFEPLTREFSIHCSTTELYKLVNNRYILFQPHVPVRLPCYDFIPVTNNKINK